MTNQRAANDFGKQDSQGFEDVIRQRSRKGGPWRVAVIANIRAETPVGEGGAPDAGADYDSRSTVEDIQAVIESDGHITAFLAADSGLPERLCEFKPHICFNFGEGIGGDAREAQVPALLELLGIPYTASRVMANAIALDKPLTKRLWREAGLPTPPFQEFRSGDEELDMRLRFPLFVKPAREGTGMGAGCESIVNTEEQLRQRVAYIVRAYLQPALVEEYLPGREFTVNVLGRRDAAKYGRRLDLFDPDGFHRFPVMEVDSSYCVTPGVYGCQAKKVDICGAGAPDYLCPANISPELEARLQTLAVQAHLAIDTLDISRVDIRLDVHGEPQLLDINPLPGMNAEISDLCLIAYAGLVSYQDLILEILYLGASRFGLLD